MFCEISGGQFSGGKVVSFQEEKTVKIRVAEHSLRVTPYPNIQNAIIKN